MILTISEFIGRLHPLLVHLPIGILLVALLFMALMQKEKYKALQYALPVVLLTGSLAAAVSCITGYLLSVTDSYDETLVDFHMWMGITVAILSVFLWLQVKYGWLVNSQKIWALCLFIGVLITGHLGGSLTHGSDYLLTPLKNIFSKDSVTITTIKPVKNIEEAIVYKDVIQPILETKCYACHNSGKQKGSLRMDEIVLLMKGGKHGAIIKINDPDGSEIIKRLLLPIDNEHHMPPKEKSQLKESQIALLHWWISNGADVLKKVKDLPQPDKIKPLLLALQQTNAVLPAPVVELKPVKKGDEKIINQLKSKGIIVVPVAQNSNYLSVNFVTSPIVSAGDLALLVQLKDQLLWLRLSNSTIDDKGMQSVALFTNLARLDLSYTKITVAGVKSIKNLTGLQQLNLVGTPVSAQALLSLKDIKTISSIYLYKTGITANDIATLKNSFPKTILDTGGYQVPTLASDTAMLKYNYTGK